MCLAGLLSCEFHAFLLLALVAEPDADDVLLEVELFGDGGDLLAGGARLYGEIGLQRAFLRGGNRRALPLLLASRQHRRRLGVAPLVARLRLGLLEPGVQDRLQGDHVVVAQRQRLEAADGALREGADARQAQVGQRFAHVGLRHAQFDPTLLEALGEGLQLPWVRLGVV